MLQGLLNTMEIRGHRDENSPGAMNSIRAVEFPSSRSPIGSEAEPHLSKTRVHRRRRKAVKAFPSSTRKPTESEITRSNRRSFGNISRRAESRYPRSQWTAKFQPHEVKRVAYPPMSGYRPAAGDTVWQHALFIDGQVYFPKNLEFCQQVAAYAGVTHTNDGAHIMAPTTSPLSPNYQPVSLKYQTKVNESRASTPPLVATERVLPSRTELQRELNLTILREQYRRFVEDMRTDHTEREEYDPTKPYYERPPSLIVEDEEYDPERPWYYLKD